MEGNYVSIGNISRIRDMEGTREFIGYVKNLPHFKTTTDTSSSEGISISYKKAKD